MSSLSPDPLSTSASRRDDISFTSSDMRDVFTLCEAREVKPKKAAAQEGKSDAPDPVPRKTRRKAVPPFTVAVRELPVMLRSDWFGCSKRFLTPRAAQVASAKSTAQNAAHLRLLRGHCEHG